MIDEPAPVTETTSITWIEKGWQASKGGSMEEFAAERCSIIENHGITR
jgi:hypothetical protein